MSVFDTGEGSGKMSSTATTVWEAVNGRLGEETGINTDSDRSSVGFAVEGRAGGVWASISFLVKK